MGQWLTPQTLPASVACRSLSIPDSQDWIAQVSGALYLLTQPGNWEQYGALTPDQCAAAMQTMFDQFSFYEGTCRVIGELIAYAGAGSPNPSLWLVCDGSSVLRADYPDQFAVIGTAYGAPDVAHFNLPDLRGVTLIGQGGGYTLANQVGEATHTLTAAETPAHSHTDAGHSHTEGTAAPALGAAITGVPVPSAVPALGVTGIGSAVLSSSGGGGAHNNIQPSMPITYLIVARNQ